MLIHAFDWIIVGQIGPNREIDTWKISKVAILYQNLARKNSFHASWSSGMTDKCPNMFHYVILSISKLWNSFEVSGVLIWVQKVGQKCLFWAKRSVLGHFFKILAPIWPCAVPIRSNAIYYHSTSLWTTFGTYGPLNPLKITKKYFFHLEKIPSGTIFDGFCRYFRWV